MRTFTAGFTTEKNKKTDVGPVWILRLTVANVDYWLSDNAFGVPGWMNNIITLPWIKSWGQLQEGISGGLDEFHVSDFSCSCLIDSDFAINMETLALTTTLEQSPAELYLWFHGLNPVTDPPKRMWRGYIKDVGIPDDITVDLQMEDETTRLNNYVGNKINVITHPLADPDDIGKVIPIVYGTVTGLPALCVDSGWVTSIVADVSTAATAITVSELPAYSVVNRIIIIDDEQMFISGLGNVNHAAATNGGIMTAPFGAPYIGKMNNGGRIWTNQNTDGWYVPAGPPIYADALPINLTCSFSGPKTIQEIRVYFVPDDYVTNETEPDINRASTLHSHQYFYIEALINGAWQNIYSTSTNNKALVIATFSPLTATAIRLCILSVRRDLRYYGPVVELEAWGPSNKILAVTRGYSGTNKVVHTKGSTVIEKKATPLVYLIADHAVDSIGTVMARVRGVDVDITSDVTKYKGISGNQLGAYPGKAAITVADFAKVQQRISIILSGGVSSSDAGHNHSAGNSINTLSASQTATGTSTNYGYVTMSAGQNAGLNTNIDNIAYSVSFAAVGGTIQTCNMTATVTVSAIPRNGYWYLTCEGRRVSPVYQTAVSNFSVPITHDAASMNINRLSLRLGFYSDGGNYSVSWGGYISAAARNVTYTSTSTIVVAPSPSAVTVTSTLGLSGNSVADIMLGDMILVDVTRNITTPSAVIQDLLTKYGGGVSLETVGTMPAGYYFNGAITEYKKLLEWCNILAFQCRSRFRMSNGTAQLAVMQTSIVPIKTITQCVQNNGERVLSRSKAPVSEVINKIIVLYARDWTRSGDDAYLLTDVWTDAPSIAIHGTRERPELFKFDFVTSLNMANQLIGFFISWFAKRRWLHTFDTYLDHCELEYNDHVTMGFLNNKTAIITEARLNPGESTRMDKITFVAEG